MSKRPLIWPMRAIFRIGGGLLLVAGIQLLVLSGPAATLPRNP